MSWISFGQTSAPLLAGRKTMTWREWNDRYAQQFVDRAACSDPHCLVDAYDRLPRNGGKKIATIRLLSVEKTRYGQLDDDDWEHEGLAYLHEHPEHHPKRLFNQKFTPDMVTFDAFRRRRTADEVGWCIRFELVEVVS